MFKLFWLDHYMILNVLVNLARRATVKRGKKQTCLIVGVRKDPAASTICFQQSSFLGLPAACH